MEYFHLSDRADLMAMSYDNWKVIFMEQRVPGTLQI
jgi:arylsulfatase